MNFYSYLNASIGFIFAALLAGKYPKKRPMAIENPIEIIIPEMLGRAGYPKILEAVIPRTIPKIRPMNRKFDTQNPQKPVMALFFAQILILCIAYMRI